MHVSGLYDGQGGRNGVRTVKVWRVIGERRDWNVADLLAVMAQHEAACICCFANHGDVQFPFLKDLISEFFFAGLNNHEHTLLGLGEHHLVRRHIFFALRHFVEINRNANAAFIRHLDGGRCEARRAHILDGDDGVSGHKLKASFDEEFFREGVADLNGGALFLRVVIKLRRGHCRAVDAVTTCFRADIKDRIAYAFGGRVKHIIRISESNTHGVDQNIAIIAFVEIRLAAHSRNTDTVTIAANTCDNTVDELLGFPMRRLAETQSIH